MLSDWGYLRRWRNITQLSAAVTILKLNCLNGYLHLHCVRELEQIYLFLEGNDPRLDLFQGEVIHCFCCGVRQVGQMCAEISEQLSWNDETDIFIDHCKNVKYNSKTCSWKMNQGRRISRYYRRIQAHHTCFYKGLQGFQLISICKLNGLFQNLSISAKDFTGQKPSNFAGKFKMFT